MQIQKNIGMSDVKASDNKPVNIAVTKIQPQASHPVPTTAPQYAIMPRSIASLIASLNLPKDKLSANLLFLMRFFSLPMKPEQLNEVRRQAFILQQENVKQALTEKLPDAVTDKNRSALLLAAAAAESKGVELSPRGLELYADAIDPEWKERQAANRQNKDRKNKDKNKQEENNTINGISIKKMTQESEENNSVLSILNKLPSKKKQRWIVLPFNFNQNGRDFHVSIRILVDGDNAIFTAVDIKEALGGIRYSFVLEFANDKVSKLGMYVSENKNISSRLSGKWQNELAELFEIPVKSVFVKIGSDNFPETDFGEKLLRFIDEAV